MNTFIDWMKPVFKWGEFGFVVVLILLLLVVAVHFLWELAIVSYQALRYDRFGICYKCKEPFTDIRVGPADQMYGPDQITQGVCKCGNVGMPSGNRRFAEW